MAFVAQHDTWAQSNDVQVHGFIEASEGKLYKLLVGGITNNMWQGEEYPNATSAKQVDSNTLIHDCGFATGCLFELFSDETEHVDVAAAHPAVVARMRAQLEASNRTVFAPWRPTSPHACAAALSKYHDPSQEFGWWGPFADGLQPDLLAAATAPPTTHE